MEPIPGPAGWPFIGNLLDIDINNSMQSFMTHAQQWGKIFKLHLGGADRVFLCSYELINEVCSRKEFVKHVIGSLGAMAEVAPHGLVTADKNQETWGLVRRALNPAFAPASVRNMFGDMLDITSQLVLKWARDGPEHQIDIFTDCMHLTLDILGLTTMDTRFNSFYHDEPHHFVKSMSSLLAEAQRRSNRPAWYTWMQWRANRQFDENTTSARNFCADVLARRRHMERGGQFERKDLLAAMLHRRDPVTGRQLTDPMIIDNILTFLYAGSDTTASLLSFTILYLIRNPDAYKKVQEEVDRVLKGGPITIDHLDALPYIKSCLLETLRLEPPGPMIVSTPIVDDATPLILQGRYAIHRGQSAFLFLALLHRDPAIFGDDANEFRPERMTKENVKSLPNNAFKPFGNRPRSCIGNEFALQQAILAVAVLFQKFDFSLVDPDYKLQYQPNIIRKPMGLKIFARLRPNINILSLNRDLFVPEEKVATVN
ncbi:cytochrome P450 [Xylaria venustula]|nr:cytochrome P450 [Xylaria venustula]